MKKPKPAAFALAMCLLSAFAVLSCSSCSGSKKVPEPPAVSLQGGSGCDCGPELYGCGGETPIGCSCSAGKSPETDCKLVQEGDRASSYCCADKTTRLGEVVMPATAHPPTSSCGKAGARKNRAMVQYGTKKPLPVAGQKGLYGDTGDPALDRIRHAAGVHHSVKLVDEGDAPKNLPPELADVFVDIADKKGAIPDRYYADIVNAGAKAAHANCNGKNLSAPTDPQYGFQYGLENAGQQGPTQALGIDVGTVLQFCDSSFVGVSGDDAKYNNVNPNCTKLAPKIAVIGSGVQRDTWELNGVLRGANCESPNILPDDSCLEPGDTCNNNKDCCSGQCMNKVCVPNSTACYVDDTTGDGLQPGPDYVGGVASNFCHADPRGRQGPCSCPHMPVSNSEFEFGEQDCGFHETGVAAIIAASANKVGFRGVAPKAQIIPVKTTGPRAGSVEDEVRGLMWLIGPKNPNSDFTVINASQGYSASSSAVLDAAISVISSAPYNKWLVVPLDNLDSDCLPTHSCPPSENPNVVTVGGLNRADARADIGFFAQSPTRGGSCAGSSEGYTTNTAISTGLDNAITLFPKAFFNKCNDGSPCRVASDCTPGHGGGSCNSATCETGFNCQQWCIPVLGSSSGNTGHTCMGWCLQTCPSDPSKKCFSSSSQGFPRVDACVPSGSTPDGTPWTGTIINSMTGPSLLATNVNGNSFASPVAAAALALYKAAHPAATLAAAKAAMQSTAVPLTCGSNADCIAKCGVTPLDQQKCFGAGRLNMQLFLDGCPP